MRTAHQFTLYVNVHSPDYLWDAAEARAIEEGMTDTENRRDMLGTREEPNLAGCLTMMLDPGSLAGCSIEDSTCEGGDCLD